MTRSHVITAVNFVTVLFIAIPISVHSVLYKIKFDPTKFLLECKNANIDHFNKYFDFSKLNVTWSDDGLVKAVGTISALNDYDDSPLAIYNTLKQKVRGRWIDAPFRSEIKDLCKDYFKPDMWWYDHVTKYFVGEERICPPLKNVPLPLNFTVELVLNIPLRIPTGEYIVRSVFKYQAIQACFENYVDVDEA